MRRPFTPVLLIATALLIASLASTGASGDTPPAARDRLGGFPDPQEVGMHNVGLLYHRDGRTAESLVPYVNRVDEHGEPIEGAPLFDAFTLLTFTTPTGVSTDYGQSRMVDWLATLDYWFGAATTRGDLELLDQAVATTGGDTPMPRAVTIMLPYMSPEVHDFGDVDGDGQTEDLGRAEDRRQVAQWYSTVVRDRFTAKAYDHLTLWGMYRMREDITAWEEPVITQETAGVHAAGLKYYWIPYFNAPGWNRWEEYGFDAAVLQPSYSFRSWLDGGSVTRSRLHATAALASTHGLGVEVETRGCASSPAESTIFGHYLADGVRYGYQGGLQAYFLGADLPTCATAANADPRSRRAYAALADYVSGASVSDPDVTPHWTWTVGDGTLTGTAHLATPATAPGVRVDLDEPGAPEVAWRGSAEVAVRAANGYWRTQGWSVRGAPDAWTGRLQSFGVPLPKGLPAFTAIRLTLRAAPDSPVATPNVVGASLDAALPVLVDHAAAESAYVQESPELPAPKYPDTEPPSELTDGAYTTDGWRSDRNVGWQYDPGRASVVVDLGRPTPVSRVRLRTNGGHDAAVNWPPNPSILLGSAEPVLTPTGLGAPPPGLRALPGRAPVVTGEHSTALPTTAPDSQCTDATPWMCTNLDGYVDFTTNAPVTTRWLAVFTDVTGWAMLSEIEVYTAGRHGQRRVQPVGYELRTRPGFDRAGPYSYADNGTRLTDRVVADVFLPGQLTGWPADQSAALRVDLDEPRSLHQLTLWSLDAPEYGIVPPAEATVEVTYDGSTWIDYPTTASLERPEAQAALVHLRGAPIDRVESVRVTIPAHGADWQWTMFSELVVR